MSAGERSRARRVTYKCLVEKEMVEALAKNVGIEKLDKYLVYIA